MLIKNLGSCYRITIITISRSLKGVVIYAMVISLSPNHPVTRIYCNYVLINMG